MKIMERIGTSPKIRGMYSWMQFHISATKCDLALVIYFTISFIFGEHKKGELNIAFLVIDILVAVFCLISSILFNYCLRRELKNPVTLIFCGRILVQAYLISRVPLFYKGLKALEEENIDKQVIYLLMNIGCKNIYLII